MSLRTHLEKRLKEIGRGSQAALARHLGIQQPALNHALKGVKGKHIQLEWIPGIAEFLEEATPDLYLMLSDEEVDAQYHAAKEKPGVHDAIRQALSLTDSQRRRARDEIESDPALRRLRRGSNE